MKLNLSNVPTNFDFRGTATIKDDESGLFAYAIVNSEDKPEKWIPINEVVKEKEITYGVKVDTTNYIWVRDIAGNTSKTYVKVEAKKFDDSNVKIELTKDNYEYTGQEIQAEILVKDEDENVTLKKDVHYTITYENNINVGTATATITGKKAYSGTKKINFTIVAVKPTITLENTSYTYDRNNKSIKSATVTGTPNGTIPTGAITYTYYTSEKVDDPNNRTTSANGVASVGGAPSKVGTYYVVAEIAAHGNYLAATSNTAILTIQPCAVTVTFNANGGSVGTNTKTVYYDEAYGDLPTATRTGYTFAGWYTSSTGGTNITKTSTVTNSNAHTLYAHWTANQYTVTLNANGGSVSTSTITVTYDSTYGTLPNPSRSNYDFSGWYTATSGGTQVMPSTVVKITANQTLYAHWVAKYDCKCSNCTNKVSTYNSYCSTCSSYSKCSSSGSCTRHCTSTHYCKCNGCSSTVSCNTSQCSTCDSYSECTSCYNCGYHYSICSDCGYCSSCGCRCSSGGDSGGDSGGGSSGGSTLCSSCGGSGKEGYSCSGYTGITTCSTCKGLGWWVGNPPLLCSTCRGTGYSEVGPCEHGETSRHFVETGICTACNGTGLKSN